MHITRQGSLLKKTRQTLLSSPNYKAGVCRMCNVSSQSNSVGCYITRDVTVGVTSTGPFFLYGNQCFPMSSKWIHLTPKRSYVNPLHRLRLETVVLL